MSADATTSAILAISAMEPYVHVYRSCPFDNTVLESSPDHMDDCSRSLALKVLDQDEDAPVAYDKVKKQIVFKCLCESISPDGTPTMCKYFFKNKSSLKRHVSSKHTEWLGFEGFKARGWEVDFTFSNLIDLSLAANMNFLGPIGNQTTSSGEVPAAMDVDSGSGASGSKTAMEVDGPEDELNDEHLVTPSSPDLDTPAEASGLPLSTTGQLVTDDRGVLSSLGLRYNTALCALICLDCNCVVLRSKALSHIRTAHKNSKLTCSEENLNSVLASIAPVDQVMDEFPSAPNLDVQTPYEGLVVYRNGYQCPRPECRWCFSKLSSLKEHWRKHHSKVYGSSFTPSFVNVQRFHNTVGMGCSFFPVLETELQVKKSGVESVDRYVYQVRKQLDKDRIAESTEELDYRLFPPWIHITRFARHVQGHNPADLVELIRMPRLESDSNELRLLRAVTQIYKTATAKLDKTPDLILQRLNTDLNTPVLENTPLKTFQKSDTLGRYEHAPFRLLLLLVRTIDNTPGNGYHIPLCDTVKKRVETLRKLMTDEVEDESGLMKTTFSLLADIWAAKSRWIPDEDNLVPDPTIRVLALHQLRPDGRWNSAIHGTQLLAQFEYTIRMFFLSYMHALAKVKALTGSKEEMYRILETVSVDYRLFYTEHSETTFNAVRHHMHLLAGVAFNAPGMPSVEWTDNITFRELSFNSNIIKLDDLASLAHALEDDLAALYKKLTWGLDVAVDYWSGLKDKPLVENLQNNELGYSFITDPNNLDVFRGCGDRMLNAMFSHQDLAETFLYTPPQQDDGVEVMWKVHACNDWLRTYEEFSRLLLVSMELKGGGPARGTELTATTFKNGAVGVPRNLMVFGSRSLCLVREYNKMSAHYGHNKPIPEAIDAATSFYVIQNCAVMRDFARTLLAQVEPANIALDELYRNMLFVGRKGLFTTDHISDTLKKYTVEHLKCREGLGVRAIRQITIAIKHEYGGIRSDPDKEAARMVDEESAADIAQAGHSRRIDQQLYGQATSAYAGTMQRVLNRFIEASVRWQHVLKIVPGDQLLPPDQAHYAAYEAPKPKDDQDPKSRLVTEEKLTWALKESRNDLLASIQDAISATIKAEIANLLPAVVRGVLDATRNPGVLPQATPRPPPPATPASLSRSAETSKQHVLAASQTSPAPASQDMPDRPLPLAPQPETVAPQDNQDCLQLLQTTQGTEGMWEAEDLNIGLHTVMDVFSQIGEDGKLIRPPAESHAEEQQNIVVTQTASEKLLWHTVDGLDSDTSSDLDGEPDVATRAHVLSIRDSSPLIGLGDPKFLDSIMAPANDEIAAAVVEAEDEVMMRGTRTNSQCVEQSALNKQVMEEPMVVDEFAYGDEEDSEEEEFSGSFWIPGVYRFPESLASAELMTAALEIAHGIKGKGRKDVKFTWKSNEQRDAVSHMLALEKSMLVVLPTGGGKSILPLIGCKLEERSLTVWVIPLNAILLSAANAASFAGVRHATYDNPVNTTVEQGTHLLFVSADKAVRPAFHEFLETAYRANSYNRLRIIFDEAHMYLTEAHYREALERPKHLVEKFPNAQSILLSATVPQFMAAPLGERMGMKSVRIIRTPSTNRPEIEHNIMPPSDNVHRASEEIVNHFCRYICGNNFVNDVVNQGSGINLDIKKRAIIFVRTKLEGAEVMDALLKSELVLNLAPGFFRGSGPSGVSCLPDMTPAQQREVIDNWRSGKGGPFLVATTAAGTGMSIENVVAIYHIHYPRSMLSYIQAIGRAGRSGEASVSVILPLRNKANSVPDVLARDDFSGAHSVHDLILKTKTCIRYIVTLYCDTQPTKCEDDPNNLVCSRCRLAKVRRDQLEKNKSSNVSSEVARVDAKAVNNVAPVANATGSAASIAVPQVQVTAAPQLAQLSGRDAARTSRPSIPSVQHNVTSSPPPVYRVMKRKATVLIDTPEGAFHMVKRTKKQIEEERREEVLRRQAESDKAEAGGTQAYNQKKIAATKKVGDCIHGLVDKLKDVCTMCHMGGKKSVRHPSSAFLKCPVLNAHPDAGKYKELKISYTSTFFSTCYFCHIPTISTIDHPRGETMQGRDRCPFGDLVKPVLFWIYFDEDLRQRALTELGASPNLSFKGFQSWLSRSNDTETDLAERLTNAMRLFIWGIRHKGLPSASMDEGEADASSNNENGEGIQDGRVRAYVNLMIRQDPQSEGNSLDGFIVEDSSDDDDDEVIVVDSPPRKRRKLAKPNTMPGSSSHDTGSNHAPSLSQIFSSPAPKPPPKRRAPRVIVPSTSQVTPSPRRVESHLHTADRNSGRSGSASSSSRKTKKSSLEFDPDSNTMPELDFEA